MHTTRLTPNDDRGRYWIAFHNSDWSGLVSIQQIRSLPHNETTKEREYMIPGEIFLAVSESILEQRQDKIMDAIRKAMRGD